MLASDKKGFWFFKLIDNINVDSASIDNYAKGCLNIDKVSFIKEIIDNETTEKINKLNLQLTEADGNFVQHLRGVSNILNASDTEMDDI